MLQLPTWLNWAVVWNNEMEWRPVVLQRTPESAPIACLPKLTQIVTAESRRAASERLLQLFTIIGESHTPVVRETQQGAWDLAAKRLFDLDVTGLF
jgi:hypothetical protein